MTILLLLVMLGGGYFFFIRTPGSGTVAVGAVSGAAGGAVSSDEQALIDQLLALRSLRLDETIFSDPLFKSLKDFSEPIPPEPVGRANPFLPIGIGSVRTGTTTAR
jgi:hypothetical protein